MRIQVARDLKVVPIGELLPYEKNSRTHSDEQVAQIAASIREFGFTNPILVDGEKGIIAGHGRLLAAKSLGITDVPIIELSHLTPAQKRAYIIADNKLALNAGWDEKVLAEEIEALRADEFNLDLLGFSTDELADLEFEPEVVPGGGAEDEVLDPPAEPKTRAGDVYRLGKHRLMCGDSTVIGDVERMLGGAKVDCVFTDPPYGMGLDADYSKMGNARVKPGRQHERIRGDDQAFDPGIIFGVFADCPEILLFGADYYADRLVDRNNGSWLVWDKRVEERFDSIIGSAFELIWSKKRRKKEILRHEYVSWKNRLEDNLDGKKPHPTMKPVELLRRIIEMTEAASIVDLFGGSGSTLIACEKTKRTCFMMELDPRYCDVIVARWEKYTGKKAQLEEAAS